MKITSIRISNYKGFRDSGPLDLAPDFTVVVGKNNSGKSALLQSFRFQRAGAKPHLSPQAARNARIDPTSKFQLQAVFCWQELEFLTTKTSLNRIIFPIDKNETDQAPDLRENWREFVARKPIALDLLCQSGQRCAMARQWPSHNQFLDPIPQQRFTMVIDWQQNAAQWVFGGITANEENLAQIAEEGLARQVFVFDAERLNIDKSAPASGQTLDSNAANLPTMLHELQANPDRWELFKNLVSEVFPSITSITTPPGSDGSSTITICVWQVATSTMREDLAILLTDCGTGVGQVLAILYVAMTRAGHIIVIDEPNSFLHPGASRKLIEILKRYNENQYIISTHSADLIAAIQPTIIHRVNWNCEAGESSVERVKLENIDEMSALLSELGVKLSDVFGADRVVWVEGQTEAACFPVLAKFSNPPPQAGTVFACVRATGDFEKKSVNAKQIWEIYRKLTQGAALLPPTVAFSFDREGRNQSQLDDLARESGGLVKFLPKRLLENYFLHAAAIAHVIKEEFGLRLVDTEPPAVSHISDQISAISAKDCQRAADIDWNDDENWLKICDAAKILSNVFKSFNLTYAKIRHGESLSKWISENDKDHLAELMAYLATLWTDQTP